MPRRLAALAAACLLAPAAATNEAGTKFLAEKAKEPGVVSLPSGLMYKVLREARWSLVQDPAAAALKEAKAAQRRVRKEVLNAAKDGRRRRARELRASEVRQFDRAEAQDDEPRAGSINIGHKRSQFHPARAQSQPCRLKPCEVDVAWRSAEELSCATGGISASHFKGV